MRLKICVVNGATERALLIKEGPSDKLCPSTKIGEILSMMAIKDVKFHSGIHSIR